MSKQTYPQCPKCGSTKRKCYRPSEHEAMTWHVEREVVMAQLYADKCSGCKAIAEAGRFFITEHIEVA